MLPTKHPKLLLLDNRGFVHPPVGGQFDEYPIVTLGIADPSEGNEDVALDELPPLVRTSGLHGHIPWIHALLDGEAAVLRGQIDAIPLPVHPQLLQTPFTVVPQERIRDHSITGLPLDAIGEVVRDDNDLVVVLLVQVALLVHDSFDSGEAERRHLSVDRV